MTLNEFQTSPDTLRAVDVVTNEFKKYGVEVEKFWCAKNQKPIRTKDGQRLGKEFYMVLFNLSYTFKDKTALPNGIKLNDGVSFTTKIISPKNGITDKLSLKCVMNAVNTLKSQFKIELIRQE